MKNKRNIITSILLLLVIASCAKNNREHLSEASGNKKDIANNICHISSEMSWGDNTKGLMCGITTETVEYSNGLLWFTGSIVLRNTSKNDYLIVKETYYPVGIGSGLNFYNPDNEQLYFEKLVFYFDENKRIAHKPIIADGAPGLIESVEELKSNGILELQHKFAYKIPPGEYFIEGVYENPDYETILKRIPADDSFWADQADNALSIWKLENKTETEFYRGAVLSKKVKIVLNH